MQFHRSLLAIATLLVLTSCNDEPSKEEPEQDRSPQTSDKPTSEWEQRPDGAQVYIDGNTGLKCWNSDSQYQCIAAYFSNPSNHTVGSAKFIRTSNLPEDSYVKSTSQIEYGCEFRSIDHGLQTAFSEWISLRGATVDKNDIYDTSYVSWPREHVTDFARDNAPEDPDPWFECRTIAEAIAEYGVDVLLTSKISSDLIGIAPIAPR